MLGEEFEEDVEANEKSRDVIHHIAPECFVSADRKVISWQGENYYTMEEGVRLFFDNLLNENVESTFHFRSTD